jgi:1-acyl-sn-glycerol-3-phosphate acyltransferase
MRSGAPLLPVGIAGTHRIFPGRSRWPNATRIRIRIGEPFALPHQPDGRLDRNDLAEGTDRIMGEIARLLPSDQQPVAVVQESVRLHDDTTAREHDSTQEV